MDTILLNKLLETVSYVQDTGASLLEACLHTGLQPEYRPMLEKILDTVRQYEGH